MHTRVKICGITTAADARIACDAGVDAIGLVFWAGSKRCVDLAKARDIAAAVSPFVTVVGLLMDHEQNEVQSVADSGIVDLLQFHGSESPEFCRQFNRPWIKALGIKGLDKDAVNEQYKRYQGASGFLIDSHAPGAAGGTGEAADWQAASQLFLDAQKRQLILAGGLNSENVADAIATLRPAAVDVSSGVEREPGIKSVDKIARFMAAVREADQIIHYA